MRKKSLADLGVDESGVVESVGGEGAQFRRLLDLGIVAGTRIEVWFKAFGGDPAAYFFRGTVVALRKCDAEKILMVIDN